MTVLEVDNVSLIHSAPGGVDRAVLQNLQLRLEGEDLVVVVGPSGCGKTSLLNLIAGYVQPSTGTVRLDGQWVKGPDADRGVIFQQHALLPWMNVLQNVAYGLQLRGVGRSERKAAATEWIELVGLQDFSRHKIWELSGGMKQRVALARGLASNPTILLMDEPFASLDPFTREQMQEVLLSVWRQTGKQILLITHDVEEAVFLASNLIVLSSQPGRVIDKLSLSFNERLLAGESAREVKSDPEFIRIREQVLHKFFSSRNIRRH